LFLVFIKEHNYALVEERCLKHLKNSTRPMTFDELSILANNPAMEFKGFYENADLIITNPTVFLSDNKATIGAKGLHIEHYRARGTATWLKLEVEG